MAKMKIPLEFLCFALLFAASLESTLVHSAPPSTDLKNFEPAEVEVDEAVASDIDQGVLRAKYRQQRGHNDLEKRPAAEVDEVDDEVAEADPDVVFARARERRSANGHHRRRLKRQTIEDAEAVFSNNQGVLRHFRDRHYITAAEAKMAQRHNKNGNAAILRMMTPSFGNASALTLLTSSERSSAVARVKQNFVKVVNNYDEHVSGVEVSNFDKFGMDDLNRTIYEVSMVIFVKGDTKTFFDNLSQNFSHYGEFGDTIEVTSYYRRGFSPVPRKTVYHVILELPTLKFMPQFSDLTNSASLKIINQLLLLTRPLMRNCFGEFFRRSVIMEFYEGPDRPSTVASMGFLLEENEYNDVDMDTVWRRQLTEQQRLGVYPVTEDFFVIYEVSYVPEEFQEYLVAKETRAQRALDTEEYLMTVLLPSFGAMLLIGLVVIFCAFEGWCCKQFIEDEDTCCCLPIGSRQHFGYMPNKKGSY